MRISDWSSDVCSSDLVGSVQDAGAFDLAVAAGLDHAGGGLVDGRIGVDHLGGRARRVGDHERLGALAAGAAGERPVVGVLPRSEEHTSELQSLMRISYAVF